MITKVFASVDELKINEIGTYIVNGWTINVTEKVSGGWKCTMIHESGKEKAFDNSITHIRKKASANGTKESKPKGESNKVVGTTKKIVTNGVKLQTFDEMETKAHERLAEYNKALLIVKEYEAIFANGMPNKFLALIHNMQCEQKAKIDEIRNKERTKKIFTQRYELAKKHLENLEKELLKNVMLDKLENVPTLKAKIKEQTEHVERMKAQSEKF